VEKEEEALEIIAELKEKPASFEKLAMEKSKDTNSKPKGGDIGWIDLNKVVPEFGTAVAKMEKGTFTEVPVKTKFGYDIILLEESRPKEGPSFDEVKPNLTQKLQMQNMSKHLDDLKVKAKIEIMETPAATAK
jgi:peptidyl-prolyl cis-trans isomerase C